MAGAYYLRGDGAELVLCSQTTRSYPRHSHVSVFTLGAVLEGAVELVTDRGGRVYRKNSVFTLPPYSPHGINAVSRYTLLCLCVRKELASGRSGREKTAAFLRAAVNCPEIERRLLEAFPAAQTPPAEEDGPLARLRRLLETRPEERYSLEEMAELAFLSKYHLIRAFQREAGLTPHQFQLQNRVRKGQRLLEGAATVAEAAAAAGFCDQSHFDRQFKRLVGLTPADYKRSCGIFPPLTEEPE